MNAQSERALRKASDSGHEAVIRMLLKNKARYQPGIFRMIARRCMGFQLMITKQLVQLLLDKKTNGYVGILTF